MWEYWQNAKLHTIPTGFKAYIGVWHEDISTERCREVAEQEVMAPVGGDEFFTRCKLHIKYWYNLLCSACLGWRPGRRYGRGAPWFLYIYTNIILDGVLH
jgi:hypothetical protein